MEEKATAKVTNPKTGEAVITIKGDGFKLVGLSALGLSLVCYGLGYKKGGDAVHKTVSRLLNNMMVAKPEFGQMFYEAEAALLNQTKKR